MTETDVIFERLNKNYILIASVSETQYELTLFHSKEMNGFTYVFDERVNNKLNTLGMVSVGCEHTDLEKVTNDLLDIMVDYISKDAAFKMIATLTIYNNRRI